jgi:PleD family two-component response regulator
LASDHEIIVVVLNSMSLPNSKLLPDHASRSDTRILIVDDEPHICVLLSHWLSDAGYSCDCATSAADAWSFLQVPVHCSKLV